VGGVVVCVAICAFAWYMVKTHQTKGDTENVGAPYIQRNGEKRPAAGEMIFEMDMKGKEQTGTDPVQSSGSERPSGNTGIVY
jgi:hypothetical protein